MDRVYCTGIITAGLLMVDLRKVTESNFEEKASDILKQIHLTCDSAQLAQENSASKSIFESLSKKLYSLSNKLSV